MWPLQLVLLLSCMAASTLAAIDTNSIEDTLSFLERGERLLKLTENADLILTIGNTGSGKSTFVHFVAGDYSKLISVEPENEEDFDYIIIDGLDQDPSNTSSTVSRTILPEKVVDEKQIIWYDCPGFSDTRNTSIEIANAFFMKRITDSAARVKLVIIVNYASVTRGYDRTDFDKVLNHVTKYVKNINQFRLSVSLVVSKVPPFRVRGTKITNVTEEAAIKSAAEFITEYAATLPEKSGSENKTALVNALLNQTADAKYSRIGIFWRPNEAGPLNKIEKYIVARRSLRDMVNNRTSYASVAKDDFGYSLSDEAELNIQEMSRHVVKNISSTLNSVDAEILNGVDAKLSKMFSLYDSAKYMSTVAEAKRQLVNDLPLKELPKKLGNLFEVLNATLPQKFLDNIARQQKNMEFLQLISKNWEAFTPKEWLQPLSNSLKYIEDESHWRDFLVYLYNSLSEYKVQQDVTAYNVENVADWGKPNRTQGIFINDNNFNEFIKTQPGFYQLLKDLKMSSRRYLQLNEVLELTLKQKLNVSIENNKLVIQGEYVKLSSVNVTSMCRKCDSIEIFAINTFFVDSDFAFHSIKQFTAVANKWEIVGSPKIDLSGLNNEQVPEKPFTGTYANPEGKPGRPGEPGYNGGNFFGLANEVLNGQNLLLNISGGNGGRGQDGSPAFSETAIMPVTAGETFRGADGRDILQKAVRWSHAGVAYAEGNENDYQAKLRRNQHWGFWDYDSSKVQDYRFNVYPRFCCKSDGLAGIGGLGGLGGAQLFIWPSSVSTLAQVIANVGNRGTNGTNVPPCKAYARSVSRRVSCSQLHVTPQITDVDCTGTFEDSGVVEDSLCTVPSPYTSFNEAGTKSPPEVTKVIVGDSIIAFKSLLRKHMKPSIRSDDIRKIYDAVDNNSHVNSNYTIANFIKELNTYETQFYELHDEIKFLPFYESFLRRLEHYSIEKANQTSKQDRKILASLYTTTLTKITALRNGEDSNLIIDVQQYFDVAIQNIRKLETIGKVKVINEIKNNYVQELNAKIDEANTFINDNVQPEIDRQLKRLESEMDEAMTELISKQNATIDEIKKNKEILRKNSLIAVILIPLEVVSKVAGHMGPEGKLAAAVIGVGTDIGRGFLVDPNEGGTGVKVPDGVSDVASQLKAVREERKQKQIDAIKEEIDKLEKSINEDKEIREEVRVTMPLMELKRRLEELKKDPDSDPELIESIKKDLRAEVGRQKKQLQDNQKLIEEDKEKVSKWLDRAEKAVTLISNAFELYKTIRGDIDKVDKAADAVKQSEDKLKQLREFEKTIYGVLVPQVSRVHDSIEESRRSLGTKSLVALDVENWRMKQVLQTTRTTMLALLDGFDAEATVKNTLDRIDEAFLLLSKIYERIQNYQEQTKLASYMGALQTASFTRIRIDDPELEAQYNRLEVNVQSNIIIGQFLHAISGFKQNAFPYASIYLSIYELPPVLSTGTSLGELIQHTVPVIESLSQRIKELNATVINRHDANIHVAHFNSDTASMKPFYIWRQKEFGNFIADLLGGRRVYIVADIERSLDVNAVKFNRIGIEFRGKNKTIETELKQLLQPVHISMVHTGVSYYRCGNQTYTITSPTQDIQYSYENTGGLPNVRNAVYDKLNAGNILLSPYTLWAVQLSNGDFNKLASFANVVDIELFGDGQYVSKDAKICTTNLEKYYHLDESLSQPKKLVDETVFENLFMKINKIDNRN